MPLCVPGLWCLVSGGVHSHWCLVRKISWRFHYDWAQWYPQLHGVIENGNIDDDDGDGDMMPQWCCILSLMVTMMSIWNLSWRIFIESWILVLHSLSAIVKNTQQVVLLHKSGRILAFKPSYIEHFYNSNNKIKSQIWLFHCLWQYLNMCQPYKFCFCATFN